MSERWEFVLKAKGQTIAEAFHYIGFGDHYECLEGALRTFFVLYPQEASKGYNVYLRARAEDGSGLLVLFGEDGSVARQKMRLVAGETE